VLGASHAALDREGVAAGALDLGGLALALGDGPAGRDDARAGTGERDGDAATDSGTGSRDDRDFPFEQYHGAAHRAAGSSE
jgi:hypothetical protein